jgi:PAS domain-containing protein
MEYHQLTKDELILELEAIKKEFTDLKASFKNDISERQRIEFELQERLKELRCHNGISAILNQSELSLDEAVEKIVQIIPAGMQFPEAAMARITFSDKIFQTRNFSVSKYSITREINADGKIVGQVAILYPENNLPQTKQIFLPEETDLLFSISVRIGNLIERINKNEALLHSETTFRKLVETINDVIFEIATDGIIKYVSPAIERMLEFKPEELYQFHSICHPRCNVCNR